MTPKFNISLIFTFLVILCSCGIDKKKNSLTEMDAAAENLSLKYNAIKNWDTAYWYTADYQEEFIEEKKLMLFKGRIYDIIKADSTYVIKILDEREDSPRNFLAVLKMTAQQYEKVFDKNTSNRGAFVIQLSKITSSNPSVKIDETSEEDGTYTYTHLSDDKDQMICIFYGSLIDFHLNEIDKK